MNALKRWGRGAGGTALDAHKSASTEQPLEAAPLPQTLILPLEGGLSARDVSPAIQSGQRVLRGQPLVQGGGPLSTWTHASTSGVVRSLERHPVAHARRREALCAVIDVDGDDEPWPELERPDLTQWETPEQLALAFSRAGLAGLGGAVFPTGLKLAAASRRRMRLVVVNGVECEPYISCDDMLMRARPRDVLAGALALVELTGAERGIVVIEEDKPEAQQALEAALAALEAPQVSIATVPTMYPAGGERQLIRALTGHEVPSLANPTDIGYLCQNVGTAAALYRFLQSGDPVTSRVTTVTGDCIESPRNLDVRLGTPIADLIAACGGYTQPAARLIMGGSMMGITLATDAVPVGRSTNCIIAAAETELRSDADPLPCIRCGNCSDVCPAYLMPQELLVAAEHDRLDTLEDLGLFDCIECGLCDVVCPSHIRLTDTFRIGKRRRVQAMGHVERVKWLDAREETRRQRVADWELKHGA
ncbi:MAG: electron transport complex subunit RsxC, partial [Gammaproteobacteria bacterium]|nr:electron transport complex subunit RsxC [Gammaproteobacteria bacterium]